jgi:hypothetical protein
VTVSRSTFVRDGIVASGKDDESEAFDLASRLFRATKKPFNRLRVAWEQNCRYSRVMDNFVRTFTMGITMATMISTTGIMTTVPAGRRVYR